MIFTYATYERTMALGEDKSVLDPRVQSTKTEVVEEDVGDYLSPNVTMLQ
jgi:hypothetical protein